MTDSIARSATHLALVLALAAGSSAALASTHHRTTHHRATAQHRSSKPVHHGKAKPAKPHDTKPAGVTGIPAGGIKLFCPAHRNPLLIRKSTQGAGTTVTVVCR